MKKLFILLITISALALGFLSCSNDLHNGGIDLSSPKCDIIGDMNGDGASVENGKYTFTYSNGMSAWGGGNGTLNYKLRPNAAWDGSEIGGENIVAGTVPSHLEVTESNGNAVIKGLKDGGTYTLIFVSAGANLELSIEANDATPNYTYIDGFYILSKEMNNNDIGNAGKQILMNGTTSGSDVIYTISYLPKEGQETIGFEIANASKGIRYRIDAEDTKATQTVTPDDGKEVKLVMNPKKGKNIEIENCLPMKAQIFITVRTTAVTKDKDGKSQGGDIYVSVKTGDDITPAEILDVTDLASSPMGIGLNHKKDMPGVFEFLYSDKNHSWGEKEGEALFKVRKNGAWDGNEYGDPYIIGGELPEDVEVVSNSGTKEEQENAKVTGLKDNQGYRWTFTVSNDDPESLILDIAEIELEPIEIPATAVLCGDMGEVSRIEGDPCKFTVLFDNSKHSWGTSNGTWAFCLLPNSGNWNGAYRGGAFIVGKLPTGVEFSILDDSDKNGGITGLTNGKEYIWTFTGSATDVSKIILDITEATE